MSTLFSLTGQYQYLLELIAEQGDEQALVDTLESINDEIEIKADGYIAVIRTIEGEQEVIDAEIKRLMARKKYNDNAIKRMKEALKDSMIITGKTKFKTELNSFSIRNNAPSLEVEEGADIPEEFYITQEPKLDKRELLKYVKENGEFDGVTLKQSTSLAVR